VGWSQGWIAGLLLVCTSAALAGPPVAPQGSAAPERTGWVPLAERPVGLSIDHGVRVDDAGEVWVRVRGPAAAFGPFAHAPLPPPPEGYRLPDDDPAWWDTPSLRDHVVLLGTSVQGRPIEAVWLGQPPGSGVPSVRLLGAHHGDEGSSWELVLDVVERLATSDDPAVEAALVDRTVWVVPYVNPDGAQAHTRRNIDRVDINRNYDVAWVEGLWSGEAPLSAPETRAVARWGQLERPVMSLSVHSGAENLGWVWNHTEEAAPDATALERMAEAYRDALGDPDFWITNGADWYVTNGDTNDWSYGRYGGWDYTLELTNTKSPPIEQLDDALPPHVDAAIQWLTQPLWPVQVVDAVTGEPVAAEVRVGSGQPRWTDPVAGTTGLPEPPAAWSEVVAWAPGYGEAVADDDGTVRLEPVSLLREAGVVLSLDGRPCPTLPGPAPWTLHRGSERVSVAPGDVVPAPGVWSVEAADGSVAPHALVVGDRTGSDDLAAGARAFQAGLPGLREVDPSIGEAHVAWAGGEWVVLGDVPGVGQGIGDGELVARGAACASLPGSGHHWLVVLSIGIARRRRKA